MKYSPPAERHERHESTPDPAKHETNLGVGWTPPVFPSGDTNTMMKLKDWLSFTLNYVIWIGYHKFLPVARLRSENASDRNQTGNSPRKTEWSCSCQEDRNGSSSSWTAQLLCGHQLPQDLGQPSQETQPHPSPQRQMLRCSPSSWEEGHEEPGCVVVILVGMLLSLW